jgi:hypothetical protein
MSSPLDSGRRWVRRHWLHQVLPGRRPATRGRRGGRHDGVGGRGSEAARRQRALQVRARGRRGGRGRGGRRGGRAANTQLRLQLEAAVATHVGRGGAAAQVALVHVDGAGVRVADAGEARPAERPAPAVVVAVAAAVLVVAVRREVEAVAQVGRAGRLRLLVQVLRLADLILPRLKRGRRVSNTTTF